MRGLMISSRFLDNVLSGGQMINKRNFIFLKKCSQSLDLIVVENKTAKTVWEKFGKLFTILINKNFYGITYAKKKEIIGLLKKRKYDFCFISSSLGGELAYYIKKFFPNMKVIVFFHNLEYKYYNQLAQTSGKYKNLLAYVAKKNEYYAIQYADKIIALNSRDAKEIELLYGRKVDFIFPTTFDDSYKNINIIERKGKRDTLNLLFVGSNFFANLNGIRWFVKNVLVELSDTVLYVVGKGTEEWKKEFADVENLKIVGEVKSLANYYEMADAVVLPIFEGSGMKTKTAEALMYGKYIFGTTEAFQGYDLDISKVGGLCNTKEEFINVIKEKLSKKNSSYNKLSRKEFLLKYSSDTWIEKFQKFLLEK